MRARDSPARTSSSPRDRTPPSRSRITPCRSLRRLSRRIRSISTPSSSAVASPCWTVMMSTRVACRFDRAHRAARIAATGDRVRGSGTVVTILRDPSSGLPDVDGRAPMPDPGSSRDRDPDPARLVVLQPGGHQRGVTVEQRPGTALEHRRPQPCGPGEGPGVDGDAVRADPLPPPCADVGTHLAAADAHRVELGARDAPLPGRRRSLRGRVDAARTSAGRLVHGASVIVDRPSATLQRAGCVLHSAVPGLWTRGVRPRRPWDVIRHGCPERPPRMTSCATSYGLVARAANSYDVRRVRGRTGRGGTDDGVRRGGARRVGARRGRAAATDRGPAADALELRVNGVFVMDTRETTSEIELAAAALELVEDPRRRRGRRPGARLHHPARARRPTRRGGCTVVEIEEALIGWMRDGTIPHGPALLADKRLRVVNADIVLAIAEARSTYDLRPARRRQRSRLPRARRQRRGLRARLPRCDAEDRRSRRRTGDLVGQPRSRARQRRWSRCSATAPSTATTCCCRTAPSSTCSTSRRRT